MKKVLCLFGGIFFALNSWAWDVNLEYRLPNFPYSYYWKKAIEIYHQQHPFDDVTTAMGAAVPYTGEASVPSAIEWPSPEATVANFEQMRDTRFLRTNTSFPRRSSWLYPDDGCFARSALSNRNFKKWGIPVPNKLFVFGDLKVRTKNNPRGYVTWWYHVVPYVQVGGLKYVLDPAIDAGAPLRLDDWLSRMGTPSKMKVAVCASGTYGPNSNCATKTDGVESQAMSSQQRYLDLEWNRVRSLGRDPNKELGDAPPWKKPLDEELASETGDVEETARTY